jgi:hypothetical protein
LKGVATDEVDILKAAWYEQLLVAGPTGNRCQLSGSLKSDDSF